MDVSTQISYNGHRANYKITSLNSVYYHAELTDFSGLQTENENPPSQIGFIKVNDRAIASSDVISVVRDLLKELQSKTSLEPENKMKKTF
jgi:hypothetical protein